MGTLAAAGERTREEVMDYFASRFRGRLQREPDCIRTALVCRCVDLYPGEVHADSEQAYSDGLVEPFMIAWEAVQEAYAMGKQAALARLADSYHPIDDTVAEMSWWACFGKEARKPKGHEAIPGASGPRKARQSVRPAVPKVGWNDPCPCGSGKKYKKCCGA